MQEAGVDEPDMVKTDGTTIFVLSGGALHAIAADGGQPRRLDSLELDAAEFERHDVPPPRPDLRPRRDGRRGARS